MRLFLLFLFSFCLFLQKSPAQPQPLGYYLPDIQYDPAIPAPGQFFGFQIGEWHLSHDQLLSYFRLLDVASDRVTLHEYARSHEQRPLIYLTITSEANHLQLQSIQMEHVLLCDPAHAGKLDVANMPVVIYQGFSIHGNEASGANAAPLVAYYLAAGQSGEVEKLLNEAVIIFDPAFNPDGVQRFANWANMHRNQHLTDDSADREYNEVWPGGRTNHYWFDLNRDWLPGQQPESQGRIQTFQAWKPNILTDHHEMGTNSTFFFMPGVQSRVNPITPKMNQELTFKIGQFHAAALDAIGSLYYSEEGYDDFYYGKGSTFPDAQGCIGILFEQASSRGHLRNTENGPLSFPFTIRNQVVTALSTQKAAIALRTDLLQYQRDFYKNAVEAAQRDNTKAFIIGEKYDRARLLKFVEMAIRQDIRVYELAKNTDVGAISFEQDKAFVIPLEQPQRNLILGMFQRDSVFTDSIFYDISAWTMPLAFNLEYAQLAGRGFSSNLLGNLVETATLPEGKVWAAASDYAFAFEWDEYYAPAALYYLLKSGIRAKVAARPFQGLTRDGLKKFNYGSIVISTQNQNRQGAQLLSHLEEAARRGHLDIYGLRSGLTPEGIDLGSNLMEPLHLPKVLLLVGEGVQAYDAGEIWHLLDTRYGIPVSKAGADQLTPDLLGRFNTLIMPGGNYNNLNHENLRTWLNEGGTLIALGNAIKWLEGKSLAHVAYKKQKEENITGQQQRPYAVAPEDNGARELSGAIFEGRLDLTHPIAYGYRRELLPVFRSSSDFLEPATSPYAMPLSYSKKPLMAGYMHRGFREMAPGSASILISGQGRGRVICLADNTNFRAFWYGTNKLLANAVFFGKTISGQTVETSRKK